MEIDLTKHKVLLVIFTVCLLAIAVITAVILLTPKGGQCLVDGNTYPNGSAFKSADGCNTCSCSNGQAVCTDMFCGPGTTPPDEPDKTPMKGIDVYCWEQGSATYYSILPGTNRTKTYIEVTDPRYSYSTNTGNEFQLVKVTEPEAAQFLEIQLGLEAEVIKDMILNCIPADSLME
jgi:hypothetical protein